jgi:hypothetical protein
MNTMSTADFEALYRRTADPWGYCSSEYERRKYAATLVACGPGPFGCALELGASIGVFSAMLVGRCRALVTVDAAPTAVAAARARLVGETGADVLLGAIPAAIPERRYDLVVASEILYYLDAASLDATLARLADGLDRGGRLVAVHWRPSGPERPWSAAEVHERLRGEPWLRPVTAGPTDDYLLDVLERA